MKNIIRLGLILVLLISVSMEVRADDRITRSIEVGSFSALNIRHAFNVIITQGDTHSLKISAEEDQFENIITEVRGNTLVIRRKNNDAWERWNRREGMITVYITFKELEEIDLSGACDLEAEGVVKGDALEIESSGASKIFMAINYEQLYVDISGASGVELEGEVQKQQVEASGASKYNAYDLESLSAELRASGASGIRVRVADELNAKASGASSIRYKGEPKRFHANSSSASSVRKN